MIAIDLGSNTIRFLKYDCISGKKIATFQKMVKTADKIKETKKISQDVILKVVNAILEAKSQIDFENEKIVAVTTAAMRMATNANDAILEIFEKTGINFEIIDGDYEAYLTFLAVKHSLKSRFSYFEDFLLVDIGGGSTEVIVYCDDTFLSKSFDIGIVTMSQKYPSIEQIRANISHEMVEIERFIKTLDKKPKLFIANSGTPTTIANMKLGLTYATYDESLVSGLMLSIDDICEQLNILLNSSKEKRELLVGVGRDDLIVAGTEIFINLLKISNFQKAFIIDEGLREGVAINYCFNLTKD